MKNKNSVYLIFSVLLLILSVIGGIFLFQILKQRNNSNTPTTIPNKIKLIPTDSPEELTIEMIDKEFFEASQSANSSTTSASSLTPTKIPTKIPTIIPTTVPTLTPTIIPTSTPSASSILTFSSSNDNFSVKYNSSRKLYQDTTINANRYTFYSYNGNFAVHVNSSGAWAWVNSNRQFTNTFTVSGQPTFRYDINTQTIVDLQSSDKNYTIQCVHNANQILKTECEQFIQSFQLL